MYTSLFFSILGTIFMSLAAIAVIVQMRRKTQAERKLLGYLESESMGQQEEILRALTVLPEQSANVRICQAEELFKTLLSSLAEPDRKHLKMVLRQPSKRGRANYIRKFVTKAHRIK